MTFLFLFLSATPSHSNYPTIYNVFAISSWIYMYIWMLFKILWSLGEFILYKCFLYFLFNTLLLRPIFVLMCISTLLFSMLHHFQQLYIHIYYIYLYVILIILGLWFSPTPCNEKLIFNEMIMFFHRFKWKYIWQVDQK